jgi:methionyl-tRNA formyltransferase
MRRIVFMGTPDFAVPALQALIATQQVVGVVTQPDRPAGRGKLLRPSAVKTTAQAAGIPVYQPLSLRKTETAQPLLDWQPDLIVVAAFGQILRPHVLELPRHGCLNVHASLLPRWRGAAPIQHALLAGDTETGVCLMQMDVGLDTGPVYSCTATPISTVDTAATLHDRLAQLGAELLRAELDAILAGKIRAKAQDETLSTYAPMIKKEDGRLDWHKPALALDRHIRALSPWPGAYTYWEAQQLSIKAASPIGQLSGKPGEVVAVAAGTAVCTADGGLLLQTVQLAGRRALPVAEFLPGQPAFIGSVLT